MTGFTVLLAASSILGMAQAVPEGCNNSTVDSFGPRAAAGARAFLSELQEAVKGDDKQKVASMVHYPMRLFVGNERRTIPDRSGFLAKYEEILTAHVREAISKQSAACLFGNVQGVLVGCGEVWFQEQAEEGFKIISIKSNATQAERPKAE
jgi:hypothetical protein